MAGSYASPGWGASPLAILRPLRTQAWLNAGGIGARLVVGELIEEAVFLGEHQRASELEGSGAGPVFRRGSGGPAVQARPRMLYVGLALAHPGALVACPLTACLQPPRSPAPRRAHPRGCDRALLRSRLGQRPETPRCCGGFRPRRDLGARPRRGVVGIQASPWVLPARSSFLGKVRAGSRRSPGARSIPRASRDRVVEAYVAAYVPGREHRRARARVRRRAVFDRRAAVARHARRGARHRRRRPRRAREARPRRRAHGLAATRSRAQAARRRDALDEEGVARALAEELAAPGVALFGVRALASLAAVAREVSLRRTGGSGT